jgi:hypothetical protein
LLPEGADRGRHQRRFGRCRIKSPEAAACLCACARFGSQACADGGETTTNLAIGARSGGLKLRQHPDLRPGPSSFPKDSGCEFRKPTFSGTTIYRHYVESIFFQCFPSLFRRTRSVMSKPSGDLIHSPITLRDNDTRQRIVGTNLFRFVVELRESLRKE